MQLRPLHPRETQQQDARETGPPTSGPWALHPPGAGRAPSRLPKASLCQQAQLLSAQGARGVTLCRGHGAAAAQGVRFPVLSATSSTQARVMWLPPPQPQCQLLRTLCTSAPLTVSGITQHLPSPLEFRPVAHTPPPRGQAGLHGQAPSHPSARSPVLPVPATARSSATLLLPPPGLSLAGPVSLHSHPFVSTQIRDGFNQFGERQLRKPQETPVHSQRWRSTPTTDTMKHRAGLRLVMATSSRALSRTTIR